MHWTILGAGAIGCLWAAHLQRAGAAVSLVLRSPDRLAQYRARGGIVLIDERGQSFCPVAADLAGSPEPIEQLLICTKAYDSLAALESVWHRLNADSRILVLQNGLGSQQQIVARAGAARVLVGSTTDGAYLRAPFEVVYAGRGVTAIGPFSETGARLAEPGTDFGLQLQQDPQIETTLWRKLAINCAINPLTAIHGCRNGALATTPAYTLALKTLCSEFEAVARARGIALFERPLQEEALRVARQTADNYSSMLQDIRHQRPTEIEQITGFLCNEARLAGVDVPQHQAMLRQVRLLQHGAQPPSNQY
ncbi:ketopantoate reductase family protein [Marinobacterium rhizophilum]|uniref:2-dehydropantoate 2-reductase n=1 Tax=Marinobacterium rhizophilum TaxID=420402 RepID=A0ABY5HPT2_9GAMM|nr:2-dehydropantoate 2-reductase [Marinobacterium rhizophilum]UTW13979.1 2-dehydropantoate 2-reductase [Marinobacterium rhizophilum]